MRLIFIFLLVTATMLANAQTFSVRGGVNYATQAWKFDGKNFQPKWLFGPHINIAVTNSLKGKLATQLELGYTVIGHSGYTQPSGSGAPNVPEDREAFAIAALLFKFHPIEKFNFYAGPQLGWFIGNRQNLGETDFSVAAGLEKYITDNVGFGVRYCHGITDFNPDANTSQRSKFIQLSVIVRFNSAQLRDLHY